MKFGIDKIKKIIEEETEKVIAEQKSFADMDSIRTGKTKGVSLGADTGLEMDADLADLGGFKPGRAGQGPRGPRDRGVPSIMPKLNDPVSVFRAVHAWNPYPEENLIDLNDRKKRFAIERFNNLVTQLETVLHAANKAAGYARNLRKLPRGTREMVDFNATRPHQYLRAPSSGSGYYRVGGQIAFRHQVAVALYVLEDVSRGFAGVDFNAEDSMERVIRRGQKEFKLSKSDRQKGYKRSQFQKFKKLGRQGTLSRVEGAVRKLADPKFIENLLSARRSR